MKSLRACHLEKASEYRTNSATATQRRSVPHHCADQSLVRLEGFSLGNCAGHIPRGDDRRCIPDYQTRRAPYSAPALAPEPYFGVVRKTLPAGAASSLFSGSPSAMRLSALRGPSCRRQVEWGLHMRILLLGRVASEAILAPVGAVKLHRVLLCTPPASRGAGIQ